MKKTTKRRWGLALIAAGTIAILSSCSSSSDPARDKISITSIKAPLTAAQLAIKLDCNSFTELGPAQLYVVDSGTCMINGVKYGIDTFATTAIRDSWLKIAQNYGVVPRWETATAIIYKATKQ